MAARRRPVAVRRVLREGWAVDGADGFVYTVDWSGAPVVRERMHWVAAGATATAAALYAATGESSYAAPSDGTWKGRPDTYHAFQATLLPRLPLSPTLATALRDNLLG